MREALRAELSSRNPDPGAFRNFPDGQVTLSQTAIQQLDATPSALPSAERRPAAPPAPPASAPAAARSSAATAPRPERPSAATTVPRAATQPAGPKSDGTITPQPGDHCRACNEALPVGRPITFCPHCGENLTRVNCPACGSEMELDWRFCPVCGRPAGPR
jgi:hypothetical protein